MLHKQCLKKHMAIAFSNITSTNMAYMPSLVTSIFESVIFTIFGLVMTMMVDILASKSNQFIFVPKCT